MKVLVLIVFAILCAIGVAHAPKGNTMIGEIIDKSINYMGVFAIPFILWFWEDKRTKEESAERLKKEQNQIEALVRRYTYLLTKTLGKSWEFHIIRFNDHMNTIPFSGKEKEHTLYIASHIIKALVKRYDGGYYWEGSSLPRDKILRDIQNGAYDDQIRGYIKNNLL